jgi:hypothetical protein
MSRNAALANMGNSQSKSASSIACLAFVAILATAFWAGALWIGNTLLLVLAGS